MLNKIKYLTLFFLPFLISCKKDVGYTGKGNYPDDISILISKNCATSGCHNSISYEVASGYNLETWESMFSGSNNGSPVIPYSSKFSSLCYYINTYDELGLKNTPTMPLNRPAFSYESVKKIKDWIDAGAPDINGNIKWTGSTRKKLYAVNQGCDVVTVFDAETQLPMRYIEVGNKPSIIETPHQVRVSPDGKYWYVIFVNNNIMQKFSCADDSYIGEIPLSPLAAGTGTNNALDWNTFVISKDSKRAYCVSWTQSGSIAAVDLVNKKLNYFIGGQNYYPHAIALDATNENIYVGAQTGNFMMKFDTSFSTSSQISLENGPIKTGTSLDPHDILLAPNNKLFITCQKSNEVRVYDIATNLVTHTIATGVYPQEIIYSPSVNNYFVTCSEDNTTFPGKVGLVSKINATDYSVTNLQVGYQPHGIAIDETKKIIYITSRNIQSSGPAPHHTSQCNGRNGFVNFVDLNTFTLLPKRYELSVDPYFIFTRP